MLLDKYTLTKSLTTLLSLSPTLPATSPAHATFSKRVTTTLSRLDPLLKTLQVRVSPPEGLVQAYLIHIGDRSDTNFRKILELKGVRKADQASLVELFGVHRDGKTNEQLVPMSPLLSPLMNAGGMGSTGLGISTVTGGGAGAGLPGMGMGMQTRFDPTGFGEKLFSAARDGVTSIGGNVGERVGSPMSEDAKTLEGNLKSIGKFFRRDMSGFGVGRFGGKRDGSVDDSTRDR